METLERQINQARVRCFVQSFFSKLGLCWFATLLVALPAIGALKYWPLADAVREQTWMLGILGTALGVGLIAAGVWSWMTRASKLEVAGEIDRRFALKERISSTLTLSEDQKQSEIGQALVHDAVRKAERIEVPSQFALTLDRKALLPLLPATLAAALVVFVPGRIPPAPPKTASAAELEQAKTSVQSLAKKLDERLKEQKESGLEESNPLLEQLLQGTKDLAAKLPAERKDTLLKLNDLMKDVEKRRDELAGAAQMQQQLSQLKNLQQGPAQKMANALKQGDFKKALDEIDKLQAKLEANELEPEEKQQLAEQLQQMEKALEKTVDAQKQAMKDLKEQINKEKQAGNSDAAGKLQEQLDKMAQQAEQMERMSDMAQQLKKASDSLKNGDPQQAAKDLEQLGDKLAQMDKEMEELATLDDAMQQMAECKDAMNCKECDGEGCKECQGGAKGAGEKGGKGNNPGDFAKGGGVGAGKRDKEETDTSFIDSRVSQKVGKGQMVHKGDADGPNKKGDVREMIQTEFSSAPQAAADALTNQQLPHDYREHVGKYFNALREGQPQAPAEPAD